MLAAKNGGCWSGFIHLLTSRGIPDQSRFALTLSEHNYQEQDFQLWLRRNVGKLSKSGKQKRLALGASSPKNYASQTAQWP